MRFLVNACAGRSSSPVSSRRSSTRSRISACASKLASRCERTSRDSPFSPFFSNVSAAARVLSTCSLNSCSRYTCVSALSVSDTASFVASSRRFSASFVCLSAFCLGVVASATSMGSLKFTLTVYKGLPGRESPDAYAVPPARSSTAVSAAPVRYHIVIESHTKGLLMGTCLRAAWKSAYSESSARMRARVLSASVRPRSSRREYSILSLCFCMYVIADLFEGTVQANRDCIW